MAKGKEPKAAAAGQSAPDEAALKAEVQAFASQLGLAAGGGGDGFNDQDFRPPAASKQLKAGKAAKAGKPAKPAAAVAKAPAAEADAVGEEPAGKKARVGPQRLNNRRRDAQAAAFKQRQGQQGQAQAERGPGSILTDRAAPAGPPGRGQAAAGAPEAVKTRGWNQGVGPRPGEKLGLPSLLGRDESPVWYVAAAALPQYPADAVTTDEALIEERRAVAERALENEAALFEKDLGRKNGQDARWLQQVRRSGTVTDKVAAMTLLLQESAVANIKSLDELLKWVTKRAGGRNVVGQAIDALREIFLASLLPDRKLRFFEQQPLGGVPKNKEGNRQLLYFYLEDCIKKRYGMFVRALEECSRDNLEFVKEKAVKALYELLRSKPEGESELLTGIVNKLGDPSRKIASKAGYLLACLLAEHPGMKLVVVREVERFMFRPNLAERARYYCVVFLNQMVLSHRESEGGSALAKKLIDVYFGLFKLILEGQVGHAASLARAREAKAAPLPQHRAKAGPRGKKHNPRKHKHHHPPKPGQAPRRSDDDAAPKAAEVDARILGALIAGVRRAFPYVASDEVEPLIERHATALFKMIHTAPFGVAVQALMLLFQLMASRNAVNERFYRSLYAVLLSPEVARSSKTPMFLSLVFKALRADVSAKRTAALAKRLLQVAQEQAPPFICGALMLLSELMKERPALWNAILQPEDNGDDVEHFEDLADPEGVAADPKPSTTRLPPAHKGSDADGELELDGGKGSSSDEGDMQPSTSGRDVGVGKGKGQGQQQGGEKAWPPAGGYDMRKREPTFSGAERAAWWELETLAGHVHPSAAAMARSLLAGSPIVYNGDPLRELTLTAFLDKFVQKKPKAHAKGSSLMQPLTMARLALPSPAALGSAAFAALAESEVAPENVFFHRFYATQAARGRAPAKKRKRGSDDEADSDFGSDSDPDLDDFLEAEEEHGEDGKLASPDDVFDYNDLDAAMQEDAAAGGEDDDEDTVESDAASGSEEDVNAFELASATESDVTADASDDASSGSDADAEWVMYGEAELTGAASKVSKAGAAGKAASMKGRPEKAGQAADDGLASSGEDDEGLDAEFGSGSDAEPDLDDDVSGDADMGEFDDSEEEPAAPAGGRKRRKHDLGGKGAFAPAEDYVEMLERDAAGLPVTLGEAGKTHLPVGDASEDDDSDAPLGVPIVPRKQRSTKQGWYGASAPACL
ncbi:hypothetical protein WJX72_005600 [[Myrmecia] bisecta]|uniref:CCAAT-binding factor domain-containing protein n=1 Tax=[Myrmecia] bisecta TaxID=41462 RepID=A0AAW1QF89_9CHLO